MLRSVSPARPFLLAISFVAIALADDPRSTPVGYWEATDHRTSKPCAIIGIREVGGELHGRIERLLEPPNGEQNPICTKCPGSKRNQHVLGMEVVWGLKRQRGGYSDGWALDPVDGNTYHLSLEPIDGGSRLKVFGYVRVVVKIGRTEFWRRVAGK